jgi:hemolysin activation/secretion protein
VLLFYDTAYGHNVDTAAGSTTHTHIASLGVGFRYTLSKDISAKFDLAKVLDTHQATAGGANAAKPEIRGHFSMAYSF